MSIEWNDEQVKYLRDNYTSMTCRAIALELGTTRSAVIGKAHRLGMGEVRKVYVSIDRLAVPRAERRAERRGPLKSVPTKTVDPKLDQPDIKCEPVEFMALEPHHCRWPLDDGRFCGATKYNGGSYCAGHLRQSIEDPVARRARREAWLERNRPFKGK